MCSPRNTAHHSVMGKRYQPDPVCSVQAASDPERLRPTWSRLGGLVPSFRRPLVAGRRSLRSSPPLIPGQPLGYGRDVEEGLRPTFGAAGPEVAPGAMEARQTATQVGQVRPVQRRGRAAGLSRPLAIAGGMGAAAPHVDAMAAHRPRISRAVKPAPFPRSLRALLTKTLRGDPACGGCLSVRVLCNNPDKLSRVRIYDRLAHPATVRLTAPFRGCETVPHGGNGFVGY